MAKPILSPIPIFDANEGTTAYFKVATSYDSSSNSITSEYKYEIYDSLTNLLVGSNSGSCGNYNAENGYAYKILVDSWLTNQARNYTIRVAVRLSGEDDYGEFSDPVILWCKEKPVLSFDGLSTTDENLIASSAILFLLKYQYVTVQGETLSTYQYHLYDANKNLIEESATFYGSVSASFTVNGLDNRTVFFARGTGTTRNGYVLDTGYIQIKTNYYASAEGGTFLQCKNKKADGYISISSHLADVSGITTDKITYLDTTGGYAIDLTHNEKVTFDIPYQMDFYNVKDYTMAFKVNPESRKDLIELTFDQDGFIYTGKISTNARAFVQTGGKIYPAASTTEQFYAMLKVTREDGSYVSGDTYYIDSFPDVYFINSNYIKQPSGYVTIFLQHKDQSYDLKVKEVAD